MHEAGWPRPINVTDTERGRLYWSEIIEAIAERYLRAIDLRVATLISLGPLARENLAMALDLAGWEGEAATHIAEIESE